MYNIHSAPATLPSTPPVSEPVQDGGPVPALTDTQHRTALPEGLVAGAGSVHPARIMAHSRTPRHQVRLPLDGTPCPGHYPAAGEKAGIEYERATAGAATQDRRQDGSVVQTRPDGTQQGGARSEAQGVMAPEAPERREAPVAVGASGADMPGADPARRAVDDRGGVAGIRWARPTGLKTIQIEDLVVSPYRARLPHDPRSLRPLAESLTSGVQPLQPVFVRSKGDRWELLSGHRIVLAGQHHLGWTHVMAIVLDIPDDVDAAYWVIGSNHATEKLSPWEFMRAVRILLAVSRGDTATTQREIARRNDWNEQDVSEAKHIGWAITDPVLERAALSEHRDATVLNRLTREDLRAVRRGGTEQERAEILQRLALAHRNGPEGTRDLIDVEDLVTMRMHGSTWIVEVADLPDRTLRELQAIGRRIVKHLKVQHRTLRGSADRGIRTGGHQ